MIKFKYKRNKYKICIYKNNNIYKIKMNKSLKIKRKLINYQNKIYYYKKWILIIKNKDNKFYKTSKIVSLIWQKI